MSFCSQKVVHLNSIAVFMYHYLFNVLFAILIITIPTYLYCLMCSSFVHPISASIPVQAILAPNKPDKLNYRTKSSSPFAFPESSSILAVRLPKWIALFFRPEAPSNPSVFAISLNNILSPTPSPNRWSHFSQIGVLVKRSITFEARNGYLASLPWKDIILSSLPKFRDEIREMSVCSSSIRAVHGERGGVA